MHCFGNGSGSGKVLSATHAQIHGNIFIKVEVECNQVKIR